MLKESTQLPAVFVSIVLTRVCMLLKKALEQCECPFLHLFSEYLWNTGVHQSFSRDPGPQRAKSDGTRGRGTKVVVQDSGEDSE